MPSESDVVRRSDLAPQYDLERTMMTTPTPSELDEMNEPLYDLEKWKRPAHWLRWKLVPIYIAVLLVIACVVVLTVFSSVIVGLIAPAALWLRTDAASSGWLIPVAIFFVLSFPPLFGQNILSIVCGVVWGLWIGFGITCAGTLLGEIGNYYAFRHCCHARAEKLEQQRSYYACLARVVRDGGFKIALIARYSALPAHFITAVFATCGMKFIPFTLAAVLSLPKSFVHVYFGVLIFKGAGRGSNAGRVEFILSDVLAVLMVLVTFVALWYLNRQLKRVKPQVMLERRRARLSQIREMGYSGDQGTRMSISVPEPAVISV